MSNRLAEESLRHLFETLVATRARLLQQSLHVRTQSRVAPFESRGVFGGERLTHTGSFEERRGGRGVIRRIVPRR